MPIKAEEVIEELYPTVMGEVIGTSLVDFEDAGVSLSVLDELKSLWEKNLTDFKVGKFPWDLVPAPIKLEPRDSPTFNSADFQKHRSAMLAQPPIALQHHNVIRLGIASQGQGESHNPQIALHAPIKLEPGDSPTFNSADFQKHRSAMLAQPPIALQHYNVIRSGITSQDQGGSHNPQIALQRAQEYVIKQQLQQAQPVITAVAAQTVLGRVKAASPLPLPKTHQQQTAENPLDKQSSHFPGLQKGGIGKYPPSATHPYTRYHPSISYPYPPTQGSRKPSSLNPPQLDGSSDSPPRDTPPPSITVSPPVEFAVVGKDEGVDSESPNSMDDSLNTDEDEEFEEIPELLVCLYDRVWRARHKAMHRWKCTLRDGVLIVGEKEYVFLKAHAELAW